jgi:transcriptional regulator with XRE-family HTH domain
MTGNQMRDLRKFAGLTQAELGEQEGLSRKTINEAEARREDYIERRTEAAVRALTQVSKVRARLSAEAALHRVEGDVDGARLFGYASTLLNGSYATDEQTIYNLALTAATLREEVNRLRPSSEPLA